ncbi:MAG: hypothetical protein PVH88_24915 [Ignavibacteria bacterium]|jgi:hypothetical protein
MKAPASELRNISYDKSRAFIKMAAEYYSHARRTKQLFKEYQDRLEEIDKIISTEEEMILDWYNGCVLTVLKILEGEEFEFREFDSDSIKIFEQVWLSDIKLFYAYYRWEKDPNPTAEQNYHSACDYIRDRLFNKETYKKEDFKNIKEYIKKNYLHDGKINSNMSNGAKTIISNKAYQTYRTTGNTNKDENWSHAHKYTKLFYENIIPAVMDENKESITSILKAFELSKSNENCFHIVNSFEMLIAIHFLNKEMLNELGGV